MQWNVTSLMDEQCRARYTKLKYFNAQFLTEWQFWLKLILIFSGGLDDGGESGLLGDFSPSSPLHIGKTAPTLTTAASLSQSPSSPPFSGMPPQPTTTTSSTPAGVRPAPGRLEFSPEKAGMDVTPLNLDFLDRTQPPQPLALTSITGKGRKRLNSE